MHQKHSTTSKCHDRLTDISHNGAKYITYASFCKIHLILVKIGRKKKLKVFGTRIQSKFNVVVFLEFAMKICEITDL